MRFRSIEDFEAYCAHVGAVPRPYVGVGMILGLLALWAIGGVR